MVVRGQSESQKFFSDVVWVGLSQAFITLTGLAILPALTKGYSTQTFGLWTQMIVTVELLSVSLLSFQFDSVLIRFLAAETDPEKRRRAFGTMLWPILAFICVLMALSFPLARGLSELLFDDPQYAYFSWLVMLWASTETLFYFTSSYLRARQKMRAYAVIRLAFAITRMLLIVAAAMAGYSFRWLVGGVIAIQGAFVLLIFVLIVRDTGLPKFGVIGLKSYLKYSLPLLPGALLSWIVGASDRYFITHFLDVSQTGIYSASYTLAGLIFLLYWPIGLVIFPVVSRLWEQGAVSRVESYLEYSLKLLLMLALPAIAGIYILSQPLLGILATSSFMAGGSLVLMIGFGMMLCGVLSINRFPVFLVKKTGWLPAIYGTGATLSVALNIALIPVIGLMGAAISNMVAYAAPAIILTVWGRKLIAYKLDIVFTLKVLLATAIMTACLIFIKVNNVAGIVLVIITGVISYGLALYLLKIFSREDKEIIREVFSGLGIRRPGQKG